MSDARGTDSGLPSSLLGQTDLDSLVKQATTGGASGSYVKPAVGKLRDISAREQKDIGGTVEEMRRQGEADRAKAASKYEGIEPVDLKPWTEKAPTQDPVEAFGSAGSMFAILASTFTHTPMTNSLNASAAAMNAAAARDERAYKTAFDAWKENTKLALDRHQMAHEDFTDALTMMKSDTAQGSAMMSAYAAKYGDEKAMVLAEAGLYHDLDQVGQSRQQAAERLLALYPSLEKEGERQSLLLADPDWKSGDPARMRAAVSRVQAAMAPHYGGATLAGEKARAIQDLVEGGMPIVDAIRKVETETKPAQKSNLTPDAIDVGAKTYLATGQMPNLGLGAKEDKVALLNRATELANEQGVSVGDILAGRSSYKADTQSLGSLTKMTDAAVSFEQTALKNMGVAERLAEKGQGTELGPVVNRWIQAGRKATGDPDVKAFDDSLQTVANEYAKIMSGATGAQAATEGARAEANAMVNSIDSPRAIKKVFNEVIRPDMENRRRSLYAQVDEIKSRIKGGISKPAPTEPSSEGGWSIRKLD